jgi:hypothetical protein
MQIKTVTQSGSYSYLTARRDMMRQFSNCVPYAEARKNYIYQLIKSSDRVTCKSSSSSLYVYIRVIFVKYNFKV